MTDHAEEIIHLRHENDRLRGRLVNRLTESIYMLDTGLSALRKDTPRIAVTLDRVEHVLEVLRGELEMLKGGQ